MTRGLGGETSVLKEGALMLSILANFLMTLGFISTAWAVPNTRDYDPNFEGLGLWKFCWHAQHDSICVHTSPDIVPGWFQATQAFMVMCEILCLSSLICMIVSECCSAVRTNALLVFIFCCMTSIAFLFGMIGVIIFGSEIHEHRLELGDEPDMYFAISWAYILCSVATGMFIFITVLGVLELRFSTKLRPLPWQTPPVLENIDLSPYVEQMEAIDSGGSGRSSEEPGIESRYGSTMASIEGGIDTNDFVVMDAASVAPY